ncbi:NAD-dependent epimerase/dehydratase family protein [Streptomyces aureoversilis]|uniref:NAD-dependent epimerase/dehydratase family protein n=1 Tax=Streptomyces aureoversilis TaxID=67277 RepID=A0ABW0A5F7_9ACTN
MNIEDRLASRLAGATVAVTGGFGLVGSRIVHKLRALGAHPVAVGKLDAYEPQVCSSLFGISPTDGDVIAGDITDAALIDHVISHSDYVIHAAALADVAGCTRNPTAALHNNVTGTQTVLAAAARHAHSVKRLCFVSSASVYGHGGGAEAPAQFAEDDPLRPVSVYANTKVWGEHQTALTVGEAGGSYAVVRYFSVYGQPQTIKRGSHSWVAAWMAIHAHLGLPLHLNGGGHQVRDFVHVDDIADATLLATVEPRAHRATVNVGTGRATSIKTISELVLKYYPGVPVIETPMPPGDPMGGRADITRMKDLLGWEPAISVEEGVRRYVAWLRTTPGAVPGWLLAESA